MTKGNNDFTVILLSIILLLSLSCGKKGPPTLKAYERPETPSALSALHREDKLILLWSYPDNQRQMIKGFYILRQGDGFERRYFVGSDKGLFIDSDFKLNTTYSYRVVAQGLKGVSSNDSNIVTVTPRTVLPPPDDIRFEIKNDSIELSWKASGKGVCYNIYKTRQKGRYADIPLNSKPICTTSFRDIVEPDRPVYYSIRAVLNTDIMDEGYASGELEVNPSSFIPSPPSDIRAVRNDDRIYLMWKEAPEPWVKGYRVYRRAERESMFSLVGEVRTPAFTDTVKAAGVVSYMIRTAGPSIESRPLVVNVDAGH